MKFSIDIKPLSVNQAWQGRRFSTKLKKQFELEMSLLLPKHVEKGPCYKVHLDFFLINSARTDIDNLIKVPLDCIVKKGIIKDDRKIVELTVRKYRSSADGIGVEIVSCNE